MVALLGVLIGRAATGLQDSTVEALVAQSVPAGRRATGYRMFAAVQAVAAVGGQCERRVVPVRSVPALVAVVAVLQPAALVPLLRTLRTRARRALAVLTYRSITRRLRPHGRGTPT